MPGYLATPVSSTAAAAIVPSGNLSAVTVQDAIDELEAEKAALTGATFTGPAIFTSSTSIGTVTGTEIEHLSGVTSSIQTQLNAKVNQTGAIYAVSTPAAVTVATTTPTTIATITLSTGGKPVLLVATGDLNPNGAAAWNNLQLYRDSTGIGQRIICESPASSQNNPWALTHIDNPASGTYTYTVKAWQGSGSATYGENGTIQAPSLIGVVLY